MLAHLLVRNLRFMKHVLFTLKGCPYNLLDDELHIRAVLIAASDIAKATLLNLSSHKFEPHGVTAIAMLAESHISIHTWPEKSMAVCDVFTCGDPAGPRAATAYMYEAMQAADLVSQTFTRPLL